ncbi:hypothetical protein BCR34DRAFT_571221 [Clohesyomyces aquaticus]|uniref:Rhodopsin domain-containing protein n=1 Tax=Clohesyomyces aquaticus TaxID=1231657 RepID=A0A1Y1Z8Z1_9PLEO|nr:hypothetical protein BCR34DRAFT_571221 [Clohesyomyces aquaticus]
MALTRRATIQEMLQGVDLCLVPAAPAPDGRPPNFVDPPSLQPAVVAITTVMLTIAFIVLAGRLFVNRKSLKLPDWMMVVGFIFDVAVMGTQLALSRKYRHIWDTPICHLSGGFMKMTYVVDLITGPALFFPKAAIFLFYIQIFSTVRRVRIASIVGIVIAFFAYFPASLVLSYYDAPHVGQSWDELVANGMTHKGIPGGITVGVASAIVDIYVFVLPLPTLAGLHMPLAKRIQVISLFATAFLGVAASVVCMAYRIKLLRLTDPTWQAGVVAIPIIIENNVAIIVGSLPAFASFMRKYVTETSVYRTLRSRLFSSQLDTKDGWQQQDSIQTIGSSGKQRKRLPYYELSDISTVKSHITVPGEPDAAAENKHQDGIVCTVGLTQQEAKVRSAAQLV